MPAKMVVALMLLVGWLDIQTSYPAPPKTVETATRSESARPIEKSKLELWYRSPAKDWMTESLPIGNGQLGAMIFGGVDRERIQFNEESLWAGGLGEWDQYRGGNRKDAHQHLAAIRELIQKGDFPRAHRLANKELTGKIRATENGYWRGYGAYQAFGDLTIEVDNQGAIKNYRRALDLRTAMASIEYQSGNVTHQRTYFANFPQRALVFRLTNDADKGCDYRVELTSSHQGARFSESDDNILKLDGKLPNNQLGYGARLFVEAGKGKVSIENNIITVSGARELILKLVADTNYEHKYPRYQGKDYRQALARRVKALRGQSFQELQRSHLRDYQALFSRVELYLPESPSSALPTPERLAMYQRGEQDLALEALYFQYGRYLLISSSRPGCLPANLQGKWNDNNRPMWACDYHMNINEQMIYWPAEVTNLSECHLPLIDYIDKLRAPGRVSAKEFFNARGWIVNTMNNAYGFTAPGWQFPWGFFPAGAGWLSQHAWEHYAFTGDRNYLRSQGYPIMKEAAEFWLDYLVEDSNGQLSSTPSYSPEHGGISQGASMDMQIVWDLFSNCIEASEILDTDKVFRQKLITAKQKLIQPQIGRWGQLQEWSEDRDDPDSKHRHVSHLFALHPGRQIGVEQTPDLAQAARVSLNARGDQGTGWSLAWKINFWARLHDGDRAHKLLTRLLKHTSEQSVEMASGGGTYYNLLCAHPPFQLDGNMGGTSGIAEMLLQSHEGKLRLLPAIPKVWQCGQVTGLKARGNYTIGLQWVSGRLQEVKITAAHAGRAKIQYGQQVVDWVFAAGETIVLNGNLQRTASQ